MQDGSSRFAKSLLAGLLASLRSSWFAGVAAWFLLAAVPAHAQDEAALRFPDSPFLRIDPEKIMTAERCGECHKLEYAAWSESRHATQFSDLHQTEQAQGILDRMGYRLAKRESLCLRCHYTTVIQRNQPRAQSGVSCESCHGAGRDWITVHNDYAGAEHDTESADHRSERITRAIDAGMLRPSGDLYSVAANCFECHTVPDERLINEGGHPSGSAFELVAWSDSIRHNFVTAQWSSDQSNHVQTPERRRLMFVVGKILDYEYGLRGLAMASEPSPFSKAMERRAKLAFRSLRTVFEAASIPELGEILEIGNAVALAPGNRDGLLATAGQFEGLVRRMTESFDASAMTALDPLIEGQAAEPEIAAVDRAAEPADGGAATAAASIGDGAANAAPGEPTAAGTETGNAAASRTPVVTSGQIRARPAWFPDVEYETTVPGCSCHTTAQTWLLQDKHSRSLELLSSPRAAQIAEIYGIDPSTRLVGNRLCASCHATVVTGDEQYEVFDGVSCESCHGASSGYLKPHERGGEIGFELGKVRLKDAGVRAQTCAGCHHVTDERLLAAGHSSGSEYDIGAAIAKIEHWPDTKNLKRAGPYPSISADELRSAMTAVRSARPVPNVEVVQVQAAPTTPAPRPVSATPSAALPSPTGAFTAPRAGGGVARVSAADISLPPLPAVSDSTSTEDLLLIVKRRLEQIYQALGRGN